MKRILVPVLLLTGMACMASCKGKHPGKEENASANYHDPYLDSVRLADSLAKCGPPAELNFSNVLDKAYNNKRVVIEAYLALPSTSMISDDNVQLDLVERERQFTAAFNFIVDVPVGKGNNTMKKIPLKYKEEDVQITGNNGEAIHIGDHVRITGKLSVFGDFCSISTQTIEKIEPVTIDYSKLGAEKLTEANSKDSSLKGKIVYADGTIEIPMMTMGGAYTFLFFNVPGFSDHITIDLAYGSTPAKLEPLPEHYSSSDFKIYNDQGKPVNIKKKVRVYGTWKDSTIKVESINNL
jgi:hypothetical protein